MIACEVSSAAGKRAFEQKVVFIDQVNIEKSTGKLGKKFDTVIR